MPRPKSPNYFERAPYHERLKQGSSAEANGQTANFAPTIFPDIPDDLILAVDRRPAADDWERLHSDTPGDAMTGYAYDSPARRDILAAEKAAKRLGVVGLEQLDRRALAILRAQQAIGAAGLSTASD